LQGLKMAESSNGWWQKLLESKNSCLIFEDIIDFIYC
jgi:hypothetical protein